MPECPKCNANGDHQYADIYTCPTPGCIPSFAAEHDKNGLTVERDGEPQLPIRRG